MNNKTTGGFPADAFEKLASQEDNYWWFRSRNKNNFLDGCKVFI